ncbi:MAG: RNase adapter RapZ [Eubacteriales bacterium]|nr:RNase adapter RapZ [Eubacteriales bacterium]MDD3881421.1 RNase adapter RapZ [Eubacteriales bacterium]
MKYFIVTGVSGAGRSSVLRCIEDMNGLCVDNMPPQLLTTFMELMPATETNKSVCGLCVDVRSRKLFNARRVCETIDKARQTGFDVQLIFIDAEDRTLIERYKETRRDHPLATQNISLNEAIRQERELLQPLREKADYIINTTKTNVRTLSTQVQRILQGEDESQYIHLVLESFGFKRGIPSEADLVWDVRFLPNPFYIKEISSNTGLDKPVSNFVLSHEVTKTFLEKSMDLLLFLLPHYQEEGKRRLCVAIGCTGGAHRSVAITEEIARRLRERSYIVDVTHRDIETEKASWNQ